MKSLSKQSCYVLLLFSLLSTYYIPAQICDNLALAFDGDGDFVSLNLNPPNFPPNSNFTVESWFTISSPITNCTGNFRRLFALSGPASSSRFEIGECNHFLTLFWSNTTNSLGPQVISQQLNNGCHHIAVVRNNNDVLVYLDGSTTPIYSGIGQLIGNLNSNLFRIGHWGGGYPTVNQDWIGTIDEIRLWNIPRTATEIHDFENCTLSGTTNGLITNWTLDQLNLGVLPNGNNTNIPGLMVTDMSGNNNDGSLSGPATNGFTLNMSNSNFVCNLCTPIYDLEISNIPSSIPISLISICEGDPVHFCASNNGITSLPAGSMVIWESSDNMGPIIQDPDLSNYQPANNALCFPVIKNIITGNCSNNAAGFVDRKYRAVIQIIMGTQICTYTTPWRDLRICCKLNNPNLNTTVNSPLPFNGALCEGPVDISLSINSNQIFLNQPIGPNVTIDWYVDNSNGNGYQLLNCSNLLSCQYVGQALASNLCFKVRIKNCSCPLVEILKCIPVDPIPVCGTIDGTTISTSLMPNPPNPPTYKYEICPGQQAELGIVNPFIHCNPVWQYHFDTDPPNNPNWMDLGSSNGLQNTNTLPQLSPPNPPNPAVWPPGAKCIIYRIKCLPYNWPNSSCLPCFSDDVTVCLKQAPLTPVINSSAIPLCYGGTSILSITPVIGAISYTWYCNGAIVASGPNITSIIAGQAACYWVSIYDGCFTLTTLKFCQTVCKIKAIIECPMDNPCGCDGLPITLNGCSSYDSCNGTTLTYTWSDTDGHTGTGCQFTDIPNPNGTSYTLTVTNNFGCSASTQLTFKPCL